MLLEVAYCEIYLGHLNKAKNIISKLPQNSPLSEWIVSFVQMLELNLSKMPTYLQIRNFFEIDLNNLFLAGQKEYIENLINFVPVLATINSEIYKLSARVLKNNDQNELAMRFLKRSLDIYFFDSETFVLYFQYIKYKHLQKNEKTLATKHLQYANEQEIYKPAEQLLKKLEQKY